MLKKNNMSYKRSQPLNKRAAYFMMLASYFLVGITCMVVAYMIYDQGPHQGHGLGLVMSAVSAALGLLCFLILYVLWRQPFIGIIISLLFSLLLLFHLWFFVFSQDLNFVLLKFSILLLAMNGAGLYEYGKNYGFPKIREQPKIYLKILFWGVALLALYTGVMTNIR